MLDIVYPALLALPRTLKEHSYKAPNKETGTPFQWLHNEPLWTWLGSHPKDALNVSNISLFNLLRSRCLT